MALDFGEMQPRRLPIYLLIGTSASMCREPIVAVNDGIAGIWHALMYDPRSAETVYITDVCIGE